MAEPKLEQDSLRDQDNEAQSGVNTKVNVLLEALQLHKFSFDNRASSKAAIIIKLNTAKTLLCLAHNNKVTEIENDGKLIEKQVYDHVRTTLHNKIFIPEKQWDDHLKLAKQQILAHLIKENRLDDREDFLKKFQQFIDELPEVPTEFIDSCRKLKNIDFDDWDIEESEANDPRLKTLEESRKKMLASFDSYKTMGKEYIEKSARTENCTQEDVEKSVERLPFETEFPKQSENVKRLFQIINNLERGDKLDRQIDIIGGKLSLSEKSRKKLKDYTNASSLNQPHKKIDFVENEAWYDDEDMNSYGRVLEKYGVNLDTQFSNRLTEDDIKTLPTALIENHSRYICYNIGGNPNRDMSGIHWVAIFLVKRGDKVTILYKDSKGDWNNSSEIVESLFNVHYKNKVEFIKQSQAEQEDDASCGPMTIKNLEIMARIVKEANDEAKDGIAELIRLFKGDCGGIAFTTQVQVQGIRISQSLQKKSYYKASSNDNTRVDDLRTILEKLQLSDNDITMKDGKHFNLIAMERDGNCFYSAVADQLRRHDKNTKTNETDNQPEAHYTHQRLRALTVDYIRTNRGKEFCKDLKDRIENSDPHLLDSDLTPDIHTVDQFIDFHSKEGALADSGMVGALAQALDITLKIYRHHGMLETYNDVHAEGLSPKKIINIQCTGNHYNSLADIDETISKKKEAIASHIHKIDECYDQFKDWGITELRNWSREHKGRLSRNWSDSTESVDKICEAIAVMDRANQLATGFQRLYETQKIAVLMFMQTNAKGHISQINTGEGKTTIVSVVQALKVMQGYKGHVITSNNVLASDGVKDKQLFFDLLAITVGDNNQDDKYTDGPRACYGKDIVYGSITSFQFDWLRDSFEQLKTLGGIDFGNIWVMLDEIDSLLIDQGSNIAKLSSPFPGMESLRYVYINIWAALAKTEDEVTQQIITKLKSKADELAQSSSNEDEKQRKYEECEDSLRRSFLDQIKKQMKDQRDHLINKKVLAKHLHQYVDDRVDIWIEYAFTAKYLYNENVEYKIGKDKDGENIITPVDNQNTGVSMANTILSNGLHQFLQIKHNLCLTYESLTSCYVSNVDYIKKYGGKLSGVTGTLGSKPERNLLESVFNLEFSVVPPFRPKQFVQFPGRVYSDELFVNYVAIAALGELTRTQADDKSLVALQQSERTIIEKPRAVLIVCASILDVEIIAKEVDREAKMAGLTPKILTYRDESDAHITEITLDVRHIAIATNLAGRGTDFKTSAQLNSNGGLHVIEAFLPCNKRVEDQGFGRTGRQGNNGTGQIIMKMSELDRLGIVVNKNKGIDFDEIIKRRDELETVRLNDIAETRITELEFKGQLFEKFSSQYGALKETSKNGTHVIKWIYVLKDLKEKWAFWLERQAYTGESIKKIISHQENDCLPMAVEQEYKKFLEQANQIMNGTISHNPFYSICLAERYLANCNDKSDREKARSEIEHALNISQSSELLYSAYIKLFELAIEDGGQVLKRFKKAVARILFFPSESNCPDYRKHALTNLQKAAKALAVEHDYLEELICPKNINDDQQQETVLASIIVNQKQEPNPNQDQLNTDEVVENQNLFVKHLKSRFVCLSAYKENVESLIRQINGDDELENSEDSIGPYDGVIIDAKVPQYLSKLDSQNELKKHVTNRSVNELDNVGMSAVYQLRKIYDVHEEVIVGAEVQIRGAIVLLVSAAAIPVLLPVNGPLAGAMISEAITDIITGLIDQGQTAFNKKDYIKGKVISYGITIVTMGVSAIMSSTKILSKAMNACRSLATKLRAVKGPFAKICKLLAGQLDKLALYLEKMIETIEFARKTAGEQAKYLCQLKDAKQLERFQKLQKSLKFKDVVLKTHQKITSIVMQAAKGAIEGVVVSVAIERIVIASLNNLMAGLQIVIKEKVRDAVSNKIKEENKNGTFDDLSCSSIDQAIKKLQDTGLVEDIEQVSKEIALGIMRHSSNWKLQLATLALETVLSGVDIKRCTQKMCDKYFDLLRKQTCVNAKRNPDEVISIDGIITKISDMISGILYGKIVALTGKVVVTLPKALYRGYKKHQEQRDDKQSIADMEEKLNQIDAANDRAKAAKCAHDAVSDVLGLDGNNASKQLADATNLAASEDGASIDDTKKLFERNGIKAHSCGVEDAPSQFAKQDSDRGVVCLSGAQPIGHIMPVFMEGNCIMVSEDGHKIPLDQYKEKHGFDNAEFVIPKGVNSSTMENIKHQLNRNRIANATHPIDYVGQDGGKTFGKMSGFSYDDGKIEGNPGTSFLLNVAEGNSLIPGGNPAHTYKSHVGLVEGKSTFRNKKECKEMVGEALSSKIKHTNVQDLEDSSQKRVITAKVKKFDGYENGKRFKFKYIKIVQYKPAGSKHFLPQTAFPCYLSQEELKKFKK